PRRQRVSRRRSIVRRDEAHADQRSQPTSRYAHGPLGCGDRRPRESHSFTRLVPSLAHVAYWRSEISAFPPPGTALTHRFAEGSEALSSALAQRYRIERVLGVGGMAKVWVAEDLRHKRRVAIKVLHPELSAVLGPDRFLKEIELTAALQHPHILPL